MGPDPDAAGAGLSLLAQVVPDIPTFSVDDGFAYLVPDDLADQVVVGSIVRVPVSGRRLRGTVVGLRRGEATRLKPLAAVSGDQPVLTAPMLEALRWCAVHYVAPLSVVLAKCRPPGLPRRSASPGHPPIPGPVPASPAGPAGRAFAAGTRRAPFYLMGAGPWAEPIGGLIGPTVEGDGSVMVIAATVVEARALAADLATFFGERVVVITSDLKGSAQTSAWMRAATGSGLVVVGTRQIAFWPVNGLGVAVVIEEGRKSMKDRQTPTVHVRDLLRRRAAVERFGLVFAGPVPTGEALAGGAEVVALPGRPRSWPLVEVVDRTDQPPGGGFVTDRAMAALAATVRSGGRALVFTHRRGYAPAFRCDRCRTIRICPQCGARAEREPHCRRCGGALGDCRECGGARFEPLGAGVGRITEELSGRLGASRVGAIGDDVPILVGTERDLVESPEVDVAVVVDADGLILAPHYRAAEEALRTLARVAARVGRARGRRCIVQTAIPAHPVIATLRRGDPLAFLRTELEHRAESGMPPSAEMLVVEATDTPADADADLRTACGNVAVFGPAGAGGRVRWLLQADDLRPARIGLRRLVQQWRDAGTRVRVDADPLDL